MPTELFAAHAVLPGHPDAVCDSLADALVDAAVALDRAARCDVAVSRAGETLLVAGALPEAVDVAAVVGTAARVERTPPVAGGHVVAVGQAIDQPGTNDLPAEYWLARHLALRLGRVAPAGELIVLLEGDDRPTRLAGFSCALGPDALTAAMQKAVRAALQDELAHLSRRVPGFDSRLPEGIALHPFAPPPHAASGRYSPLAGKDLAHPARAAAIAARRLAKAVVRSGVARSCRAVLTVVPGQEEAMIVGLSGDGQRLDPSRWAELVDRSLAGIGRRYAGVVSLAEVTRAGHFLRDDWPWERVRFDP